MPAFRLITLAAILCLTTLPLAAQDLAQQFDDASPETVELTPLATDTTLGDVGLTPGFDAIQFDPSNCTNQVCVSIVQNPGDPDVWCEDCNGCVGTHASNWSTSAGEFAAGGNTFCAGGLGMRNEAGAFECKSDSAGVICKDCGTCLLHRSFC